MLLAEDGFLGFEGFDTADVEFDFVDFGGFTGGLHEADQAAAVEGIVHLIEIGNEPARADGELCARCERAGVGGDVRGHGDDDAGFAGVAGGFFAGVFVGDMEFSSAAGAGEMDHLLLQGLTLNQRQLVTTPLATPKRQMTAERVARRRPSGWRMA